MGTRNGFHPRTLLIAIAAVVLSFVASLTFADWALRRIQEHADVIALDGAPSLLALEEASSELRELDILIREYDRAADPGRKRGQLERTRAQLGNALHTYFDFPVDPGEAAVWPEIREGLRLLDDALESVVGNANARPLMVRLDEYAIASQRLGSSLRQAHRFNVDQIQRLAASIRELGRQSTVISVCLDAISTIVSVGAVLLVLRAARNYQSVVDDHTRFMEERAAELEQFAGRIAHDVLSPLMTASLAIDLAERAPPDALDRTTRSVLGRGSSSVRRIQRLVDGLLEFARAGARPPPGAHSDFAEVLADVTGEFRAIAADAGTTLELDEVAPVGVAASPGVLTSILSNLLSNAMKSVMDRPTRIIAVHVQTDPQHVHVEIEDSGGGVPPEVQQHLFNPFARSVGDAYPERRLGLATVKRIVEAHGGRVGFRPKAEGSVFWFEIPRVDAVSHDDKS